MNPGDLIEVQTDTEKVQGRLVPSMEEGIIILKLDSGYNIGILENRIVHKRLIEEKKETKAEKKKVEHSNLPGISILHTGGTIASKVDYKTGGVIAKFDEEEMAGMFPEIANIASISSRQILQTQSEMMRLAHYNIIAKEIEKELLKKPKGIIVTHGTDTMHYTSAALAFMLQGIRVPVLLVGSQRSSDRGSTDASLNMSCAAYYITESDYKGVAICMHETINDETCLILPPTKTRKMHTSRRDAFRPINTVPIARVNYRERKITEICRPKEINEFAPTKMKDDIKVAIIKTHPSMMAEQFLSYKGYDGLIIEGTGLGHIPNEQIDEYTHENKKIQKAVETLIKEGTVVVMSPQTIYGRIQMNVYTPQRELQEIGVLGHLSDMTPETTFIKLAWLLSNKMDAKLISKDLIGEITEGTKIEAFLN